jgi:hypothetical protein
MNAMKPEAANPILPAGLPDDWFQPLDVHCPTCRYNLRMLRMPRCPECGLVFRWQVLLDVSCPRYAEPLGKVDEDTCPRCNLRLEWPALFNAATVLDRGLFEYSDHPVRAAFATWIAALNPWRFWKRIPLESPPAVPRLRRLRLAAITICLLGLVLVNTLSLRVWRFASPTSPVDFLYFICFQLPPYVLALTIPLVTLFGLPRFTPTLLRFRVRREQLLRCFCYASAGLLWIGLAFWAGFGVAVLRELLWPPAISQPLYFDFNEFFHYIPGRGYWARGFWAWGLGAPTIFFWFNVALSCVLIFLGLVWWWVFLYLSLRRYLRLDRSNTWALFVSTQLCGLLLMFILLLSLGSGTSAIGAVWWWLESKFGME